MRQEVRRCGRLDDHTPHDWKGSQFYYALVNGWTREVYWCKGHTVVEGGHHANHR